MILENRTLGCGVEFEAVDFVLREDLIQSVQVAHWVGSSLPSVDVHMDLAPLFAAGMQPLEGSRSGTKKPVAGSAGILTTFRKVGPLLKRRVVIPCLLLLASLAVSPQASSAQMHSPDSQVAAAVLAGPAGQRAGAKVLGFDASRQLVTLRNGSNQLVCLADDPSDDRFSVACYHESLEPYMARGRELASQGMTDGNERLQVRWKEAEGGALAMPEAPATLYVLTGSAFDSESGEVLEPYLRYVVYVPWATVESTGLSEAPMGPGSPWLMYPGTAGAHIMISPPRPSAGGGSD